MKAGKMPQIIRGDIKEIFEFVTDDPLESYKDENGNLRYREKYTTPDSLYSGKMRKREVGVRELITISDRFVYYNSNFKYQVYDGKEETKTYQVYDSEGGRITLKWESYHE